MSASLIGRSAHCSVDVARGLALLFGLGTKVLPLWDSKTRWNNISGASYNTYTLPKGDLQLSQKIARRAVRWGAFLSPEDIVITSGCMEAIALALSIVTRPGDTVAIESPTYFGLLQSLKALALIWGKMVKDANIQSD